MRTYEIKATRIQSAKDVSHILAKYATLKRELMVALHMDPCFMATRIQEIGSGSMVDVTFEIKDVFRKAIVKDSKYLVMAHNHPYASKAKPSRHDHEITKQLVEAGAIMHIPVLDHVILSKGGYYSFRENDVILKRKAYFEVDPESSYLRNRGKLGPSGFVIE